jgi:4-amino-4-deoxychorismate lyase
MSVWIDGRRSRRVDYRDRGLHYGDGLFETMRVQRRTVRLLDLHLERLLDGCRRLRINPPNERLLRSEIRSAVAACEAGILKLIVTRGVGTRGYRPSGTERATRILSLQPLPPGFIDAGLDPARLRICRMRLGSNPTLAGLKTLNRLESVIARMEWSDPRVWEGLMRDADGHIVCGTMSNLFLRRGSKLTTPLLDLCGVAGVMRRWVMKQSKNLNLRLEQRRVEIADLAAADEVFMSNALVGIVPVAEIRIGNARVRPGCTDTAVHLQARLDAL